MKIEFRNPTKVIGEIIITSGSTVITEDIVVCKDKVWQIDESVIDNLKNIIDRLELYNEKHSIEI